MPSLSKHVSGNLKTLVYVQKLNYLGPVWFLYWPTVVKVGNQQRKFDKKLDSFENKCLRKLLKVKWSDFVCNNTVRDRTHQQPVSNIIRKRRWKYLGHVLRSDEKRLNRQVLMWSPVGKRKRGRPKTTLRRTIQQENKLLGCKTIQDLQLLAKNRITWRSKTSALCAAFGSKGIN